MPIWNTAGPHPFLSSLRLAVVHRETLDTTKWSFFFLGRVLPHLSQRPTHSVWFIRG